MAIDVRKEQLTNCNQIFIMVVKSVTTEHVMAICLYALNLHTYQ